MPSLSPALTGAEVRTRFPELSIDKFPDALMEDAAETAAEIYSATRKGALHLAAHLAVIWVAENDAEPDGGSGVVVSEMVGQKQVTYTNAAAVHTRSEDVFYERTSYGRMYLQLRDASAIRALPMVAA